MLGTQHLALFVASGILLNVTPGQDTVYIVGRSVSQGRRAGVLSVLGISSGGVIHSLAAAFGLSAVLATSAQAFALVKLAGAAYLVYLGIRMFLERPSSVAGAAGSTPEGPWAIYRAALLTNLLNPKVALFFLAFLPQFVLPTAGSKVVSFLFLGGLFIFTGTIWCLVLVWGAAAVSGRFRERSSTSWVQLRRLTGCVFVGLGVRLAVSE